MAVPKLKTVAKYTFTRKNDPGVSQARCLVCISN